MQKSLDFGTESKTLRFYKRSDVMEGEKDNTPDNKQQFTFIHTADLHLDSPFIGISNVDSELGECLSKSTFQTYDSIIEQCIERKVDFLLIAGDVYDSADKSLYAQIKFLDGLRRLSDYGISDTSVMVTMTHSMDGQHASSGPIMFM
jgi:hypothetical protein